MHFLLLLWRSPNTLLKQEEENRKEIWWKIFLCEAIIVKTNEAMMGSGVITVPGKENEEKTNVQPKQPKGREGKTYHKVLVM